MRQNLSEDYWESWEGVQVRLNDLAEDLVYRTFNRAVQAYGSKMGIKWFTIVGADDERICDHCLEILYAGPWRAGQFMPDIPAHVGCRHYYDYIIPI